MANEIPIIFSCSTNSLLGILHQPVQAQKMGVLIVVGGPQTRVGSHRQFVLLARYLAENGIPVMRFDYRGMGDSEGDPQNFENTGPDIAAAVEEFIRRTGVQEIILWGLCDAASSICLHAYRHPEVKGIILLNPWVRTSQSLARARMQVYYSQQLKSIKFWKALFTGNVAISQSAKEFAFSLVKATGIKTKKHRNDEKTQNTSLPLAERMIQGLEKFSGRILVVLSGNDLTAEEFRQTAEKSKQWGKTLNSSHVSQQTLPEADHTFSTDKWRSQIEELTLTWIQEI